ncbi:MAG: glycosyltransferase family 2 protein [Bacteroidales bacterium]|nr:glycosyltransferase family 2 protein [Bacteroidales bacterium]
MTPLLSIITPVRNTALFLRDCIDSILAQDFQDWELILIDDGSTDNSPEICKGYAKADTRIKHLRQSHQGQGIARNKGISMSQGRYLTFVDSDDMVRKDTYRLNLEIMEKRPQLEILQYPIVKFVDSIAQSCEDGNDIEIICDIEPLLRCWLVEKKISSYFCNKIFRCTAFDGLLFPGGCYEDRYLMAKVLKRTKTMGISKRGCYHYRQHSAQTTRQPDNIEMSRCLLGAEASILRVIRPYDSLNSIRLERFLNCLAHAKSLSKALRKEEILLLNSVMPSIKHGVWLSEKPQISLRCLLWNILGIERYLKIF